MTKLLVWDSRLKPTGTDMATNSDLYHAYGIRGFDVVKTDYAGRATALHIQYARSSVRCPKCLRTDIIKNGAGSRTFRLPPTGKRPAFAVLQTQRIRCPHCRFKGQLPIPFADPRRTYARSFERYILDLMEMGTLERVARHTGVGWDMVKDIHKRHLYRKFDKPPLKDLRTIAIDEFYAGRKTGYFTFVLDLASGAVVYVGKGRKAEAPDAFWKRLRPYKANITAVAMDMSRAYISAVRENLPDAAIVFDPFHVVKLMNERLDQLRRDLAREAEEDGLDCIKGARWLLLKGNENLSDEPDPKQDDKSEIERLKEALALNQPLATAYYLKEDLRRLWTCVNVKVAGSFLDWWTSRAESTGLKPLIAMANTLQTHREGILAYFKHHITSGPMEAMNNKIRVFQRQTYGLRDREYWELRVKSLHREDLRLTGTG